MRLGLVNILANFTTSLLTKIFQEAKCSRLQSGLWSKVDWGAKCAGQQSVLSSKLCWGARCYEEQWVLWSKLCWGEKGYRKQRELGSRVFQREKYSSRQSVLRGKVCYEANCNKPIWSKLFFWAKVNNAKGSQTVKCSGKQSVPQPLCLSG
jgi:hypothetical protein